MRHPILRCATVSVVGLLLFAAAQGAIAREVPADRAVILLQPKFGPVRFAHQRHAGELGIACGDCHHDLRDAARPRPCRDCHLVKPYRIAATRPADAPEPAPQPSSDPVRAKLAFHGLCRDCHARRTAQRLASGPSDSCRDCHD